MEHSASAIREAVYLHYLDRELNDASGRTVGSHDCIRITRLLTLLTQAELYCGLSALWENDRIGSRAMADFQALFLHQQLQTVSSDVTLDEFLHSRRVAYTHDQERYAAYFTTRSEDLNWLNPTWQKVGGSTRPLARFIEEWARQSEVSGRWTPTTKFVPTVFAIHKPILEALRRREDQAITYTYFRGFLGDHSANRMAERAIRREISNGFTADYLSHGSGDIVTGIPELEAFDHLAAAFPLYDARLLGYLAALTGLGYLTDPISTDVDRWLRFLLARSSTAAENLAACVRWMLLSLHARENQRLPLRSDDSDRFQGQHQVRLRMLAALREAARVVDRLAPASADTEPEAVIHRALQRLIWLSNRLGAADRQTKAILDQMEFLMTPVSADVVLVTVTDLETTAVTEALDRAGLRGRSHFGPVNSYWLYGPVGGATVAHVRSTMGSTGQGGSTLTTVDAIRDLRPTAIIGTGMAFGIDERKQPIGQLLVSERLTEYEKVRVAVAKDGSDLTLARGPTSECSPRLLGRFRDAHLASMGIDVRVGEMLSGEKLIDNLRFRAALLDRFPEAIGGEMEGAGVQAACGREGVEWVVVKAVCDYAQEKSYDKDARQRRAAETAAKAVVTVLERGGWERAS